jgi:YD repeat-containing protein
MNRGTFHNGVIETTAYNNRLQVSSIIDGFNGGTTLFSKSYGYSDRSGHNNGNILSINDVLSSARNQTFSYDPLNRLAAGVQADNSFNIAYSYDPWGNMQSCSTISIAFSVLGSCNQVAQFCYDAAGH